MRLKILFPFLLFGCWATSQQTGLVDFKKIKASLSIEPENKLVKGTIKSTFDVLRDTDSIYLDARSMKAALIDNKGLNLGIRATGDKIWLVYPFKANTTYTVGFQYWANPKKAMYFIGWDNESQEKQLWTQGQGKYTSNWLPSSDDMNEKIEFDIDILFDADYEVIANGKLTKITKVNDSLKRWDYDMKKPMSSYLVALAIGKYHKKVEVSKSGIPIEMYFVPEDSLKFEPSYRYSKKIFDFLEEEIQVPYPWQDYKQIPVKDFLYAGMENTGTTIFSDAYMIDDTAFNDRNYVNVNAHELAHQWFGNLVTATSGKHHWLQEGFATYYALLAEKEIFGDEYYEWQLYQSAQQLIALSEEGKGESLLDPKASSLTFYQKGAWTLHMLREEVGDSIFKKGIKSYLNKYRFLNANTNDFIAEMEEASGKDLVELFELWLAEKDFPADEAMGSLLAQPGLFIDRFFQVKNNDYQHASAKKSKKRFKYFEQVLQSDVYYPVKQEVVLQIHDDPTPYRNSLLKQSLNTGEIHVRQMVSQLLNDIPDGLQADFESLLNDKSYITIENALYKLWLNFPDKREAYLNQTKNIQGFNDKNIRILWLALALVTQDYQDSQKPQYYKELAGYTSPRYSFEVRQNAFRYLKEVQALNDQNIVDLVNAAMHHSWRFAGYAKEMLKTLAENEVWEQRIKELSNRLSAKERDFIQKTLNIK